MIHRWTDSLERLLFASIVTIALFTIAGCGESSDEAIDASMQLNRETGTLGLSPPDSLIQSRMIINSDLFAEITVRSGGFSQSAIAEQIGNTGSWEAGIDVPQGSAFTITITWYDTTDNQRLDLVTSTERFSPIETVGPATISSEFSDFQSDAFDADQDSFTNLAERLNGTFPFNADSVDGSDTGTVPAAPTPITPTGFIAGVSVNGFEGVFLSGPAPSPLGSIVLGPPPSANEALTFISGGSIGIPVASSNEYSTVYVASDNEGYFLVELTEAVTESQLIVNFSTVQLEGNQGRIDLQVANAMGDVSEPVSQAVEAIVVSTGELQVSVSWDMPTDVDLYLREPDGTTIFFGNLQSDSGGQLDLDSNPDCNIDGINNENINYAGVAPPPGEYTVILDYYSPCDIPLPTNYVVTVRRGGEVQTFTGSLTPEDESVEREIVRFNFP